MGAPVDTDGDEVLGAGTVCDVVIATEAAGLGCKTGVVTVGFVWTVSNTGAAAAGGDALAIVGDTRVGAGPCPGNFSTCPGQIV